MHQNLKFRLGCANKLSLKIEIHLCLPQHTKLQSPNEIPAANPIMGNCI